MWTENKGRKRAPFKKGTLIDVEYRNGNILQGIPCGGPDANDWSVTGHPGDIVKYKLSGDTNE
ncbi:hypothetical protein [Vibrio phage vB_VpaP_G1]|uniref:Uncharacterized protein n=1 Tax=Vibrio phage vB_VpaP_G1 TaxID=2862773 RepID=A0AAE8BMB5_9CAUD|nr:hypothetical protein PP280_gp02 [Vibrio phage vB_VpaP_G1]YP_010648434.1 hypothetical protein PP280_gp46 [Vibrio phage vB_VpaP_G1]QYW05802.1 hypothetical protein [Vibrio phage vB_VpaP_G1]QYW05846.1 hypothetical protein [Vibrio phage vB_VpaP_G1]